MNAVVFGSLFVVTVRASLLPLHRYRASSEHVREETGAWAHQPSRQKKWAGLVTTGRRKDVLCARATWWKAVLNKRSKRNIKYIAPLCCEAKATDPGTACPGVYHIREILTSVLKALKALAVRTPFILIGRCGQLGGEKEMPCCDNDNKHQ